MTTLTPLPILDVDGTEIPDNEIVTRTGRRLSGTIERLYGLALATITRDEQGNPDFEYQGETDLWWDSQETETTKRNGIDDFQVQDEDKHEHWFSDCITYADYKVLYAAQANALSTKALLQLCARSDGSLPLPDHLDASCTISDDLHALFNALVTHLRAMSEADASPTAYSDTAARMLLSLAAAAILESQEADAAEHA